MALTSNRISVSELDFDAIKQNLKDFLNGQEQFKDYDFNGSALSVLVDLLAYNTHYNNLYLNLAVNESFLDSASKRSSVVSLAKMLGYTPRSAVSSQATVDLRIVNPTSFPVVTTLPAYQPFETMVDGMQYTFYNTGDYTTVFGPNGYVFSGVKLIEGSPLKYTFNVADGAKYIIPNQNVDISTIRVTVQDSAGYGNFSTFTNITNIIDGLNSESRIFFVKEVDGGLYELTFGDGNIGKALINGNIITVDYFVSSLDAPNGARLFNYSGIPLLGSPTSCSTKVIATGGGSPEGVESIRYNAPRSFAAQNRAVTPEDYRALILSNYAEAKSVSVWGGEVNSPAVYGKVYICILPTDAYKLTTLQKSYILNQILAGKNMVSVTPEILDPEYIDIKLNVTSYYNPSQTNKTPSQLAQILTQTITDYDEQYLKNFNGVFRHSQLSRLLDTSDVSFVNNTITVVLNRKIAVQYNTSAEYIINIINPLYTSNQAEGNIYSNGFYIKGRTDVVYLDDDGLGNIRLYTLDSNYLKVIINPSIGTVNYDTGLIKINNLNITALYESVLYLSMKPKSNDVVSALQQIVEIDRANLVVNVIADPTSTGDLAAGFNYTFSNLRP